MNMDGCILSKALEKSFRITCTPTLSLLSIITDMAKSFQPVVVSRSYKDWNSARPVKVLADLNTVNPFNFAATKFAIL